jgi:hypothetical protein
LLAAYQGVQKWKGDAWEELLRSKIFDDAKLGPLARSIIKLWYVGIWYALPGASSSDPRMVAPAAYMEGLLWRAIGANPSGAKAPGYASWAEPPQYPALPILS